VSVRSRFGLGLLVVAGLAPGFLANRWGAAEPLLFRSFEQVSEAHVVGRLVRSRDRGLLSDGGLLGVGVSQPAPEAARRRWPKPDIAAAQYLAFRKRQSFPSYDAYRSQSGGQALLFTLLDRSLPLPGHQKLRVFRGLTAIATAVVLASIVVWFRLEVGWTAALLVALSIALSRWLTMAASNLFWSLWSFYLPLAVMLFWVRREGATREGRLRCGWIVFATLLVKCAFNGFEFVTTAVVMTVLPLAWPICVDRPDWRAAARAAATAVAAATAAIAVALGALSVQIAALAGEAGAGWRHIRRILVMRTVGTSPRPERLARRALDFDLGSLLASYRAKTFCELPLPGGTRWVVTFDRLLVLFGLAALLLLALTLRRGRRDARSRDVALLVCFAFSALAPFSWLVLFRQHAAHHLHLDPLLWQMPFTLFGFAVVGAAVERALRSWRRPHAPARGSDPTVATEEGSER